MTTYSMTTTVFSRDTDVSNQRGKELFHVNDFRIVKYPSSKTVTAFCSVL